MSHAAIAVGYAPPVSTRPPGGEPEAVPGRGIVLASWGGDAAFAVTAIPAALGVAALDGVAVGTAAALFVCSIVVWLWALGVAAIRSAQGDDVQVGSMFLFQGPAPRRVRAHLFGALAVALAVTVATAAANPFGVLVPMLPLGLVGLWGARHGRYPQRTEPGRRG